MSENLKTIRELAEELGVSKQAIQYHIKYLTNKDRQTNDKGIVVLSSEEQRFIRSRVDKQTNKRTDKQANGFDNKKEWNVDQYLLSEIEDVRKNRDKQLAVKDKQLENKDLQISQLQNLLDQQQRLALQDKKLLEEYKAEIKDLKALTTQTQSSTDEQGPVNKQGDVEEPNHPETAKSKKWWHFGK